MCQVFFVSSVIEFTSECNYRRALKIPGFQIYKVSSYASVAQGSEYA